MHILEKAFPNNQITNNYVSLKGYMFSDTLYMNIIVLLKYLLVQLYLRSLGCAHPLSILQAISCLNF